MWSSGGMHSISGLLVLFLFLSTYAVFYCIKTRPHFLDFAWTQLKSPQDTVCYAWLLCGVQPQPSHVQTETACSAQGYESTEETREAIIRSTQTQHVRWQKAFRWVWKNRNKQYKTIILVQLLMLEKQ